LAYTIRVLLKLMDGQPKVRALLTFPNLQPA
jgi:hypothetical protein